MTWPKFKKNIIFRRENGLADA